MDEDVAQIDQTFLTGNVSQNFVHQPLNRGRGVAQAKAKNSELPQATASAESSLWSSFEAEGNLPVPTAQV